MSFIIKYVTLYLLSWRLFITFLSTCTNWYDFHTYILPFFLATNLEFSHWINLGFLNICKCVKYDWHQCWFPRNFTLEETTHLSLFWVQVFPGLSLPMIKLPYGTTPAMGISVFLLFKGRPVWLACTCVAMLMAYAWCPFWLVEDSLRIAWSPSTACC